MEWVRCCWQWAKLCIVVSKGKTISTFLPPVQISLVPPFRQVYRRVPLHHLMTGSPHSHIHQWQKLQGMWTWWVWWQTSLPQGFHHLDMAFDQWHSGKGRDRVKWLYVEKFNWISIMLRHFATTWLSVADHCSKTKAPPAAVKGWNIYYKPEVWRLEEQTYRWFCHLKSHSSSWG